VKISKGTNPIVEKSFEFAISLMAYCDLLEENKKYVIARQLLKSGTSIGANIREAQSAESLIDVIHKLKIAAKEANETEYWLLLCESAINYPEPAGLKENLTEIQKLLSAIISKSKDKLNNQSK
jgi:four helix bundle protein